MALKADAEKLNKLYDEINRLLRSDTTRATEIAQYDYRPLLCKMLVKYGKNKLEKSGVKLPRWVNED